MTREEAIDIVRNNYPHVGVSGSQFETALRNLIPELRESKDERIRKDIVALIKFGLNDGSAVSPGSYTTKEEAIAYLEKQKEQKPTRVLYIPKFRTGDLVRSSKNPRLTYKILGVGSMNDLGNTEYEVEIFTDEKPDEPRNLKHIEIEKMDSWGELIEQKLAEIDEYKIIKKHITHDILSSEVNKRLKECGWYVTDEKPTEWSQDDEQYLLICKNALRKYQHSDQWDANIISDWLEKRLKSSYQPKQEWSEEDEKIRKTLLDYYEEALDNYTCVEWLNGITYGELCDWLKSLRPQPQQNMSIGFMIYLDEHRPDGKMCLSNAECNEIETAFKNQSWDTIIRYIEKYQPHWKPSNEQMEALGRAIIRVHPSDVVPTLAELRNELQKLM